MVVNESESDLDTGRRRGDDGDDRRLRPPTQRILQDTRQLRFPWKGKGSSRQSDMVVGKFVFVKKEEKEGGRDL